MLILIDKVGGRPVGHVSAVINSNNTGWISMLSIDRAHRGKGMGRELFKGAMADAEWVRARILGLDGVREQKWTCRSWSMAAKLRLVDNTVDGRRDFFESALGVVELMMRPLISKEPLPAIEAYLLSGDSVIHI
jgi:GNAT superfamily N-acetyltransferase